MSEERTPAENSSPGPRAPPPGILIGNLGEPIGLTDVNMHAVLAEPVRELDQALVWRRLAVTSDDKIFHLIIENLNASISHYAQQASCPVNLSRADTVLLVIRSDEIEGILAEAYRAVHDRGAKIKELLAFAISSAERKVGAADTLLLSESFAHYLDVCTFAPFDPTGPLGSAGSRHAVGHGAANAHSYTQVRALQALLTLDQLAFYT